MANIEESEKTDPLPKTEKIGILNLYKKNGNFIAIIL